MIQRSGEPAVRVTVGTDRERALRVPHGGEGAILAWASSAGVVLEARAVTVTVDGRPVATGVRRLLRAGERAQADAAVLWVEAAREDTRALAGALLGGADLGALAGPRLLVVQGPAAGEVLPLRDGAVLGRGRRSELQLEDPLASRRHARLIVRGGRAAVQDLGSKNGIVVDGHAAGAGPRRLRSGVSVAIGGSVLVYDDGHPRPARRAADASGAPSPRGRRRLAAACAAWLVAALLVALAAVP
jgi:hypothetical protein